MSHKKLERVQKLLDHVSLVLVEPKYAENVGAAARVACNMGINQLVLVRDQRPEEAAMARMATHHAKHMLAEMEIYPSLEKAVAHCSWVVATSARQGRQRSYPQAPRQMAEDLLPRLAHNKVALVFGPEHRGLTNDDLALCNATVTIATADFTSLNLAQSVAILCHELFSALWQQQSQPSRAPKTAPSHAMTAMYDDLQETLETIGYLDARHIDYWMHNMRLFFNRVGLRGREARFIHGFCKQVRWLAAGRPTAKKD